MRKISMMLGVLLLNVVAFANSSIEKQPFNITSPQSCTIVLVQGGTIIKFTSFSCSDAMEKAKRYLTLSEGPTPPPELEPPVEGEVDFPLLP